MTEGTPEPPEPAWDPARALNDEYQALLEAGSKLRRGAADAATTRKWNEWRVSMLEARLVELDAPDDAERLAELREELTAARQLVAELATREAGLNLRAQRLQTAADKFRTRKELLVAEYTLADAHLDFVRNGLGDELGITLAEAEADMRRALEKIAALIMQARRAVEPLD